MKRAVAVCAGEVTVDEIQTGRTAGGEPLFNTVVGGAPVNVAAGLKAHGLEAHVWSAVGDDAFGDTALTAIRSLGIGADAVSIDPAHPTRSVRISMAADGSRGVEAPPGATADHFLRSSPLPSILDRCTLFYASGAALIGDETADAVLSALRSIRQRPGLIVAFDPNIRLGNSPRAELLRNRIRSFAASADVIQLERGRAETYGLDGDALGRVPLRIVTAGRDGAEIRTAGSTVHVPAVHASEVDPTGAGDAFLAVILSRLALLTPGERLALQASTLADWGRSAASAAAHVLSEVGGTAAYLRSGSADQS